MQNIYWLIFYSCLFISVILLITITLLIVNSKKHISNPNHGRGWLVFTLMLTLIIETFSTMYFVNLCKDYDYAINNTYIETTGTVVEFTVTTSDNYGDYKSYSFPKFYIPDGDYYIVLAVPVYQIEVGSTCLIRYYPNSRLGEIVEVVE